MKSTVANRCAIIGVATLAAVLAVNHASAVGSSGEVPRVVVRYSDLDLSQPQGARALYYRIQRAARMACGGIDVEDLPHRAQFHVCVDQAVANAVTNIDSQRLTEIHEAQVQRQPRS